jgi:teichuronic acid biosynthesis glycosyltransferase TuaH
MTADGSPLIVLVAGVNFDGNRLGAQHIAERLAERFRVLYVDPPLSPVGALRQPWLRRSLRTPFLRPLGGNLWRLTPVVPPGKTQRWGRFLVEATTHPQLRTAVRRLGGPVEALIQIPPHFRWFDVVGERMSVHLASDDFVAAASLHSVSESWVRRREAALADRSDAVVAVSDVLVDHWRALGHDPIFMPNGCDFDLMSATVDSPAADVRLPGPVAGYVGTISDRTDASLLHRLCDRGASLLLVGPRSGTSPNPDLDAVLARDNVQWVGRRDYREVPGYLARMDVGLVPYTNSEFNVASFPLKVLDYLAAGLPVVSTDLPSVRWIDETEIDITSTQEDFVAAVDRRLREPVDPDAVDRRRNIARAHSWDRRVAELVDQLQLAR